MLSWHSLAVSGKASASVLNVSSGVRLLMGIFTRLQDVQGQDVIRQTWMHQPGICTLAAPLFESCKVVVAFVVGSSSLEVRTEGDFLILNVSESASEEKSYAFFRHASRAFPWATHIVKLDMDTFPFLPRLLFLVSRISRAPYAFLGWPHNFDTCGSLCSCPPPDCIELMSDAERFRLANCWTYMSGSLYAMSRRLAEEASAAGGFWERNREGPEDLTTGRAVAQLSSSRGVNVTMWNTSAAASIFAPFGAWRSAGGVHELLITTGSWGAGGAHEPAEFVTLTALRGARLALYGEGHGLQSLRRATWNRAEDSASAILSLTELNTGGLFPCSALLGRLSAERDPACVRAAHFDLLLRSSRAHPGFEWHMWMDPGWHLGNASAAHLLTPDKESLAKLPRDSIIVSARPNCSNCGSSWSHCHCVSGCGFLVSSSLLDRAAALFRAKVSECLDSVPAGAIVDSGHACLDERVVLTRMLLDRPSLFHVVGDRGGLAGHLFVSHQHQPSLLTLAGGLLRSAFPRGPHGLYWEPQGRLGNIMFGYASLLGISRRVGVGHFLAADCDAPRGGDPWSRWWQAEGSVSACALAELFSLPVRRPSELWDAPLLHHRECAHARFDARAFYVQPNTVLHGYFQSWRYFHAVSEAVRQTFRIPEPARRAAEQRRLSMFPRNDSILACLQVRREDKNEWSKFKIPGRRYYEEAKSEVRRRMRLDGRPLAFAVTVASRDDMPWARDSFSGWNEEVQISYRASALEDFAFLQVSCDALVLGASSFGWWAAFTSERARLVIAPSAVINPQDTLSFEFRFDDYYPPSWLLLDPD